jgi:hypothetical protein
LLRSTRARPNEARQPRGTIAPVCFDFPELVLRTFARRAAMLQKSFSAAALYETVFAEVYFERYKVISESRLARSHGFEIEEHSALKRFFPI